MERKQREENSPPAKKRLVAEFVDENGNLDLEALIEAIGEEQDDQLAITQYHRELARFVSYRVEEVRVAQSFYQLPDNIPWNRQPWWKTFIWMRHVAGEEAGRKEKGH